MAAVLWSLTYGAAVHAQAMELTLADAVSAVTSQNLYLRAERYTLPASVASLKSERGRFDPVLRLDLSSSGSALESPSRLTPSDEMAFSGGVGLEGRTATGLTYDLRWRSAREESDLEFVVTNPYWRSDISLAVTHPLLRGFGDDAQGSGTALARNNLEIARCRYEGAAVEVVFDAVRAYWELYFARADRQVSRRSLDLARNLLEEAKGRIAAGAMASIEIFKAEAEVAIRQESLLWAEKAVADKEDALRALMNLDDWEAPIIPFDAPPAVADPPPLELAYEVALDRRSDYRRALIERENTELLRGFYLDNRQPQLDVVATAGFNSVDTDRSDSDGEAFSGENQSWSLGLRFSAPVGNRTAQGEYQRAFNESERAWVSQEALRQRIMVEVREAWRGLAIARDVITSTAKISIAAEKRLLAEEEKFRVGKATLNDTLEYQDEYVRALSAELRAKSDYAIALGAMERAKGTLLEGGLTSREGY